MRTHVDLFSGIGGFSLACQWAGVETIAFAETDSYASRVLQRHWPGVKNHGDVREFPKLSAWLLTAGVPCQPASVAGKRKGAADDRWLWPQTLAVVENGSYEWLLFENPTGILSLNDGLEFERICLALESKDYEVQPLVVPACGVGALHRRNRVWILAHGKGERWRTGRQGRSDSSGARERESERTLPDMANTDECPPQLRKSRTGKRAIPFCDGREDENVANAQDANGRRSNGTNNTGRGTPKAGGCRESNGGIQHWGAEPDVDRVAHGIPARVDRLRGLGNAIVPQVAFQLIKRMIEAEIGVRG